MSKARSPREVCSTTIGTIGLIGEAVYRSRSVVPGERPQRPVQLHCRPAARRGKIGDPGRSRLDKEGTMKRLAAIPALALLLLAAPALAGATKIAHTGQIAGDDET